jgi:hypothetical protein
MNGLLPCGLLGAYWVASRTSAPVTGRTRRAPAQVADRRGGVGKAAECVAAVDDRSADLAVGGGDDGARRVGRGGGDGQRDQRRQDGSCQAAWPPMHAE